MLVQNVMEVQTPDLVKKMMALPAKQMQTVQAIYAYVKFVLTHHNFYDRDCRLAYSWLRLD
ncbi:MAG TPA: hypothetical protein VM577_08580, partial [Anaerovoracaceae bacterium]|nr:hypothetical protein [Anaerovoracaceae bacterium]